MILVGDYIPKQKKVELPMDFSSRCILANLEAPIISHDLPAPELKAGPNLYSSSLGLSADSNVSLIFNLANNHMMDFGAEGLRQTLDYLEQHKTCTTVHCTVLGWGGAGATRDAARRPIVVSEKGKRIGIICCREPQFGSAGEEQAGCADFGFWVFDAIRALRSGDAPVDFVIVSCHAALEHSPFPSPRLREYYHRLIAAGADVIHGHHAHIPQGWESVRVAGRTCIILYGLGNFVVDPATWGHANPNYLWSNVAEISFGDNGIDCQVRPFLVEEKDGVITPRPVTLADGPLFETVTQYNQIACAALKDDALLTGYWQTTCSLLFDRLYGTPLHCPGFGRHRLSLRNRARYVFDALTDICSAVLGYKRVSSKTRGRAANFYNCFLCESHVEAIKAACEVKMKNAVDHRTEQMRRDCVVMKVDVI